MRLLLILLVFGITSCKTTTIYLVRHAEKSVLPAENPHLSDEGKTRAMALRDILITKNVMHIYSTNYNRTLETASPLSLSSGINIQLYKPDTSGRFLTKIKSLKSNLLIVGHSNTVLLMLDSLGLHPAIKSIPENDYDNLFIISVKNGKVKKLTESKYGDPLLVVL